MNNFVEFVAGQASLVAQPVENPPASAGDVGSVPEWRRSPREGHWNLLQYSCLENPMDRGSWRATVHRVAKSQTRPSDWACTPSLVGLDVSGVYFAPTFPLFPLLLGLFFQSVKCQNPYRYTHRGTTLCLLLISDPFSFTTELVKLAHICSLPFLKILFSLLLL